MTPSGYLRRLHKTLPHGAALYLFDPHGILHVATSDGVQRLDPARAPADRTNFHRFIDDGQFTRYLVGAADTSEANPTNATAKIGVVRPHSAFTPHVHGAEHFVLSMGYASCGLYDGERGRVVHVRLVPGALLHIPALMPHSFNNRTADPLLLAVTNTGMGVDHDDYAITAAQAEQRAACHAFTDGPDYARLAAALRQIEGEMPTSALHTNLTWRERIAATVRKLAWRLEVGL